MQTGRQSATVPKSGPAVLAASVFAPTAALSDFASSFRQERSSAGNAAATRSSFHPSSPAKPTGASVRRGSGGDERSQQPVEGGRDDKQRGERQADPGSPPGESGHRAQAVLRAKVSGDERA